MLKHIIAFFLCIVSFITCVFQGLCIEPPLPPKPPEVGGITILSGEEEHDAYVRFIASFDGQIAADGIGMFQSRESLFKEIPSTVSYADDFEILIGGRYTAAQYTVSYTLYNDKLERVSSGDINDFVFPDKAGLYLLDVVTRWESGVQYSMTSHAFKLKK